MNLLILCTWSCILIYIWMVTSKYYWLKPPITLCVLFALSGVLSTLPALIFNLFLSRETELWVYSSNKLYSFLGFFIGAGLGEEFWKLSSGVLLLYVIPENKFRLYQADIVLGFVTLGLAFGAVENLVAYSHLDVQLLICRGLIAIPLHGSMGMIHGLAVAKSFEKSSIIPLLIGYFTSVCIHTFCDTASIILPSELTYYAITCMAATLIFWGIKTWKMIPEIKKIIQL